jgi:hypothetical protein
VPADFPEDPSPSKFLLRIITYKDSLLLDLFISFKFRVEFSMHEGPMMDSITKKPVLDWAVYQYVKMDTYWSLP